MTLQECVNTQPKTPEEYNLILDTYKKELVDTGKFWHRKNGNCDVLISPFNGTKIVLCEDDEIDCAVPNNMDVKITNWCDRGCAFCHEKSSTAGKHAVLDKPEFLRIIDSLPKGTELALGGGLVTSHPWLEDFLSYLKKKELLPNITVHIDEFIEKKGLITRWIDEKLVNGVGISITPQNLNQTAFNHATIHKNIVFHTIAGIWSLDNYKKIADKNIKVLMLGYKEFGRGKGYINDTIRKNLEELRAHIEDLFPLFNVLSFDNLALNQVNPKDKLSSEVWESCYQGKDSTQTCYIDAVEMTISGHSTTPLEKRFDLTKFENIETAFAAVKRTVDEGL